MRPDDSGDPAAEPASEAVTAWKAILELVGWGDRRRPPRFPGVALKLGLTPKQMGVLWALDAGTELPMRAIGERLYCDASYVTDLVDRLEQRGLIERRPSSEDRRVTLIALTREGERCREHALELLHEPPVEFAALTAAEIEQLAELLAKAVAPEPAPVG